MPRIRQLLLLPAAGIGVAAAMSVRSDRRRRRPPNPAPLPNCETYDGSSIAGGQTTMCATPAMSN